MPRPAFVSVEKATAIVEKHLPFIKTNGYPKWSDPFWEVMSKDTGGKWTADNCYTNVKQNRRHIVTRAQENLGIIIEEAPVHVQNTSLDSTLDDSVSTDVHDDAYEFEAEAQGLDHFPIDISQDEWQAMLGSPIPCADNRIYSVLERDKWTDMLSIIIYRQTELPCAFIFKHSKIYNSPESLHYCRITGFCKSKLCNNPLFCYIDKDPGESSPIVIKMRAYDTFYDTEHEKVHRDCRGERRKNIGRDVYYMGAGNWQKSQVADARLGSRMDPNVPRMNILRQAKNEYVNRELDVKSTDGKDVVRTLEIMKYTAPYSGFIHEVKRDKFYVSYSTHAQKHAYAQYLRFMKDEAAPAIDGSGSFVKKIKRLDGSKSGHIFLYSITINCNGTTASVYDFLTESQDTDTIIYALRQWLKLGTKKPPQISLDRSRALMNAVSLALNDQTVKTYVETLFLRAMRHAGWENRSPIYTWLRNDVAHLMIMIAKWDEFKEIKFSTVRQFNLYCVALMVDSQNLRQLKEILSLTMTVALHKSNDTVIESFPGKTVADCRAKLEEYIATRKFPFELTEVEDLMVKTQEELQTIHEPCDNIEKSPIQRWIDNIRTKAEQPPGSCEVESNDLNRFYCKEFIDRLIGILYEFPLWTAAALEKEVGHSTTAFMEGHFNDLRHRVNKNNPGSSRVDKFLKRMYHNNSSSATIFTSEFHGSKRKDFSSKDPQSVSKDSSSCKNPNSVPPAVNIESDSDSSDESTESIVVNKRSQKSQGQSNEDYRHKTQRKIPSETPVNIESDSDSSDESTESIVLNKPSQKPQGQSNEDYRHKEQRKIPSETQNDQQEKNPPPKKRKINQQHHSTTNNPLNGEKKFQSQTDEPKKGKGKYYKPKTDMKHRNTLATNVHKSMVLLNGNLKPGDVKINGKNFYASNTCGFDSIIQVLCGAVMDDPCYKTVVDNSSNETLQFIGNILKTGIGAPIYKSRTKLLKLLFPQNIIENYSGSQTLKSYNIDLYSPVSLTWKTCFALEPSIVYQITCPRCGSYSITESILAVDQNVIRNNGYNSLQDSLTYYVNDRTISCSKKNCAENCSMKSSSFAQQIYIELDLKIDISSTTDLSGKLKEIPQYLNLKNHQFRLAGVIAGLPRHFIAYCWRVSNTWELCNDFHQKVLSVSPSEKMVPRAVIYIQIPPTNESEDSPDSQSSLGSSALYNESTHNESTTSPTVETSTNSPVSNLRSSNVNDHADETPNKYDVSVSDDSSAGTPPPRKNFNHGTHFPRNARDDPDTHSTDNWRNKGQPDYFWVSETDEDINNNTNEEVDNSLRVPSVPILRAGNIMPAVKMNNTFHHINNTTKFDSLIHILSCAASDDLKYRTLLDESEEKTLKFIGILINQELDDSIYAKRAALLSSLYPLEFQKKRNAKGTCIINLDNTFNNTWEICFKTEPSILKVFNCKNCDEYTDTAPIICIDPNLIFQFGFTALQKSVQFHEMLTKVKCHSKNCKQLCTVMCIPNFQVFINLEVRSRNRAKTPLPCKLKDIPKVLDLGNPYRLVGIVAYHTDRFVAYCLRCNDNWELYDAYSTACKHANDSDIILHPCGAIYILQ